jgi:sarcosine oxidase delta subunit
MAYNSAPFRPSSTDPDTIPVDLNNANTDFTILSQCFVSNDPTTAKAKDSDKIDGIDLTQLARVDTIPTFTGGSGGTDGGEIHLAKPPTTTLLGDVTIDVSSSSRRVFATNSKTQSSGYQINFETFSKIHDVCLVDGSITETVSTVTESELTTVLNKYKYIALPSNTTLTINLPSGVFSLTDKLTLPQLGGNSIIINGVAPTSFTITGAGSVTGSAGNWSVPINLSNATGIAVGDYVGIDGDVAGTGSWYWIAGCWKVIAVSGNTVTVKNTARFSAVPTFTLTGGTLWKFNTVLKQTTSSVTGVILYNLHEVSLNNVAIVTDNGNGTGLQIYNCPKVSINKVGITNFGTVMIVTDGTSKVHLYGFLMSCGSAIDYGCKFWWGNSHLQGNGNYFIINGNYNIGLYILYNNCSEIKLISCANGSNGFVGYLCNAHFNNVIVKDNVSTDIYVIYQARVIIPSSSTYGTISPAVNTWGNVNSYIATY